MFDSFSFSFRWCV